MSEEKKITSIDEYIAQFDPEVQKMMQELRATIREAAPQATEKISWGMPTFDQNGNLIHFANAKNHIGLYPGPSGVEAFLPKLEGYKTSKGAIQLPKSKPMPLELVREIVLFKVKENTSE